MTRRKKSVVGTSLLILFSCLVFYFCTGFFVVQPIGALPEGATIWYWRLGTRFPFISSADGLLLKKTGSVSLMGRAGALAAFSGFLKEKKIAVLPYSRTLYLISTGGYEFKQQTM